MQTTLRLRDVTQSPITEAYRWVADRDPGAPPLLDLSQAVPGWPPPPELRDHLASVVQEPATSRYTEQFGLPPLRDTLAADMGKRYGSVITAGQTAICAGCNQAFSVVISALASPGDQVILPLPYYFNHEMWLRILGIEPVYLPSDDQMQPDLQAAEALITSKTKAIVLITPNNPTGAVYEAEHLDGFYELAQRQGIALLLDETYRDFRQNAKPPHSLFARENWPETLVHLYSFSKSFALAGYRVGAFVASPALIDEANKVMDCVAICAPAIAQRAALYGLEHLSAWREHNRKRVAERLRAFTSGFSELAESSKRPWEIVSAGAYFAYVKHPFEAPSRRVAEYLAREHGVLTLSGDMFGPGQERYLRLSIANLDRGTFPELYRRLERAQQQGLR